MIMMASVGCVSLCAAPYGWWGFFILQRNALNNPPAPASIKPVYNSQLPHYPLTPLGRSDNTFELLNGKEPKKITFTLAAESKTAAPQRRSNPVKTEEQKKAIEENEQMIAVPRRTSGN